MTVLSLQQEVVWPKEIGLLTQTFKSFIGVKATTYLHICSETLYGTNTGKQLLIDNRLHFPLHIGQKIENCFDTLF